MFQKLTLWGYGLQSPLKRHLLRSNIYFILLKCLAGQWRRLRNEEFHSFYRSPNIYRVTKSRRLRWAGHVARMKEGRSAFKILIGTPTGKIPLGRPRRRWENG